MLCESTMQMYTFISLLCSFTHININKTKISQIDIAVMRHCAVRFSKKYDNIVFGLFWGRVRKSLLF